MHPTSGSTASVPAYTDGVPLTDRLGERLRALGVREGQRIGIACSGGADSVALLHLVARTPFGKYATVLHVDHNLRADSADDAEFVASVSEHLGLRCQVLSVHVDPGHPDGPEAAAREVRYAALEGSGLDRILTGHTRDDQAETVLLRTIRGGSLAGIAPVRGVFVRPLLDVGRQELRSWLRAQGLDWREDPTNADVRLERNWIRSEVMPKLRGRRPGVAEVLARLASRARADEEALDGLAAAVAARAEIDEAGLLLRTEDIDALPAAVFQRVVRQVMRRCGIDPRWTDIDAVTALRVGAHTACGQTSVWRLHEGIAFVRDPIPVPAPKSLPRRGVIDAEPWGVRMRVGPADAPAWRWRCDVPADAETLVLRARRPGDRVPTKIGRKKVQDVLVDAKVPRPLRDLVPLLATPSAPLAVVGLTTTPERASLVIDVEPAEPTWSKRSLWTRASG